MRVIRFCTDFYAQEHALHCPSCKYNPDNVQRGGKAKYSQLQFSNLDRAYTMMSGICPRYKEQKK